MQKKGNTVHARVKALPDFLQHLRRICLLCVLCRQSHNKNQHIVFLEVSMSSNAQQR